MVQRSPALSIEALVVFYGLGFSSSIFVVLQYVRSLPYGRVLYGHRFLILKGKVCTKAGILKLDA
jgi:hypothetical protein